MARRCLLPGRATRSCTDEFISKTDLYPQKLPAKSKLPKVKAADRAVISTGDVRGELTVKIVDLSVRVGLRRRKSEAYCSRTSRLNKAALTRPSNPNNAFNLTGAARFHLQPAKQVNATFRRQTRKLP